MLIERRSGVATQKERVFALLWAGAALGRARSTDTLGCCYFGGHGVVEHEARVLVLRRESAAAGSCFGQFVVGVYCNCGLGGVAQDHAEAARLFHLAASQGHGFAQYCLAWMFENGRGGAQDRAEAIRLHRLAAAHGLRFDDVLGSPWGTVVAFRLMR
jgi:uncharacterized protein